MEGKKYSHRYYANYDKDSYHITGWYDMEELSHTLNVPDEKDLHPLTEEEWDSRKPVGQGIKDGNLVTMCQDVKKDIIAKAALSRTRELLLHEYVMHNLPIPQEYVDYQTALKKVINGESDTLPESPSS